jgi:beta-N-acetylhexosaminidase
MIMLEELVGQLVVPYVNGSTADETDEENRRRFGVASPAEAVRELHLGGVIYFAWSRNTRSPAQIAELSLGLQSAGGGSLMIGIDQEIGGVDRIGPALTPLPSQWALGGSGDPALTAEAYLITARELRALGITTDYAPVADVNVNPDNPVIGVRSFGADPAIVAEHTAVAVRVLQYGGISAVAKHFPGHGDTSVDSHLSLPVIAHSPAQWEHLDAPPFRAAIAAGVDGVMTGHLAFPELDPTGAPATLSAPLIALLRDLGFEGVILSDSLRMEGVRVTDDSEVAIRTLEAGADVILDPPWPARAIAAVVEAVRSGRLSQERIEASVRRVQAMNARAAAVPAPSLSVVGCDEHRERARTITMRADTGPAGARQVNPGMG